MRKANGIGNVVEKVITYILVVLLVLVFAGGVSYFALRSQGMTYYVEFRGKRYLGNGEGGSLSLPDDADYTFKVSSLSGETVNYDVEITSNGANNFDIVSGGKFYRFYGTDAESNDYSDIFGLKKGADSFTLTIPKDFSVEQAVKAKYGENAEIQTELQTELPYFVLTVTADESKVKLLLIANIRAVGIELNTSAIVF